MTRSAEPRCLAGAMALVLGALALALTLWAAVASATTTTTTLQPHGSTKQVSCTGTAAEVLCVTGADWCVVNQSSVDTYWCYTAPGHPETCTTVTGVRLQQNFSYCATPPPGARRCIACITGGSSSTLGVPVD